MSREIQKTPIGNDWAPAVRACAFFCWGDSILSREISRITDGPSHMGIGFRLHTIKPEAQGPSEVYYENLFAGGFQGPKDLDALRAWARANPKRRVEIYWLTLDPIISERKHVVAHTWVGLVGYAEWKLVSFLWFELLRKKIGIHIRPSWNRWVCSTSAACILSPEVDLSTPDRSLDEVTPRSARDVIIDKKLSNHCEVFDGGHG